MTAADGEEKSRFRWLDAARYAVAAAVTVLILAVIVNAIKVVLRLDSLQISVDKGSITAFPFSPAPAPAPEEVVVLAMELTLRGQNPSGRVRMYFLDISAYLFDNKTSASASLDPQGDSIFYFNPQDTLLQQETVDCPLHLTTKKKNMGPFYFDMLYNNNGSRFSDMTLRLDGNLVTEVTSEFNKTRLTTYYCKQLLVSGKTNDEDRQDVICKQRTSA